MRVPVTPRGTAWFEVAQWCPSFSDVMSLPKSHPSSLISSICCEWTRQLVGPSRLCLLARVELSGRVEQMTGLTMDTIEPSEFDRLMVLVRVAPDPGDNATEITAINLYYRAMKLAKAVTSLLPGQASNWCRSQLGRCSYFAAVTLDRRLVPVAD
jgi:hypothetical protein